jgi:hypothetical protein
MNLVLELQGEVALLRQEVTILRDRAHAVDFPALPPTPSEVRVTPASVPPGGAGWRVARNGRRPSQSQPQPPRPVRLSNPFASLEEEDGDTPTSNTPKGSGSQVPTRAVTPTPPGNVSQNRKQRRVRRRSVLLLGDSNVNRLRHFVKSPEIDPLNQVEVVSLPGAKIANVRGHVSKLLQRHADDVLVILQAGVNDLASTGSEVILNDLVELVKHTMECRSRGDVKVMVCAIPERIDQGSFAHSRAAGLNARLDRVCHQIGAKFLDWRPFVSPWDRGLGYDGVHFSPGGSLCVGHRIRLAAQSFLA